LSGSKILPKGYSIIDRNEHDLINHTPFNPALDGYASESQFSASFAREISSVMTRFAKFFSKHGTFGSLERFEKLPSDWWFDEDFFSNSRVLSVDLLSARMQRYEILEGVRAELLELDNEWMLCLGHRNEYNSLGEFTGDPGEYSIWITRTSVRLYSERIEDLDVFFESLPL
jgi:hypothetical protein